jgi:hypothetical protein
MCVCMCVRAHVHGVRADVCAWGYVREFVRAHELMVSQVFWKSMFACLLFTCDLKCSGGRELLFCLRVPGLYIPESMYTCSSGMTARCLIDGVFVYCCA